MHITKVKIKNFKCFRDTFVIDFTPGINVIVGNNEEGKSTILEAIHLTLSGLYNGRYIKNELSEYFFNYDLIQDYKKSLTSDEPMSPPEINIEVFFFGNDLPMFEGDFNSTKTKETGVSLKIALDEKERGSYNDYVRNGAPSLPIEYYEVSWHSFAREAITPRRIPLKSVLIDSSSNRYHNGSDVYINHIIKNHLDDGQKNSLTQTHRKLQATFGDEESVIKVNEVIKNISKLKEKDKLVKLGIDLSSNNAWENSFITYVEDVPFHHIGKGEQAIVKTKLALQHKKSQEANVILLEEPENHLSHTKLYELIGEIRSKCNDKQIILSTHSSFVANKLGLENLIILNDKKNMRLKELDNTTYDFFKKVPGYDTLRLILCNKAILVEGDSDELVVQKAFMKMNDGKLPIELGVDVISVGTSFLRFLEIAEKINKQVAVVTDNDGDVEALCKKYSDYLGTNKKPTIKIFFDSTIDTGNLIISDKPFNYNTLEPKMLKVNDVKSICKVLNKEMEKDDLLKYMQANKTECALKIFDSLDDLNYPQYILDAIQ